MKYESDILEMIHENATINFKLGFISEARMREFDELCLSPDAEQESPPVYNEDNDTVNLEHLSHATVL